jgi:hypothetical protein
LTHFKHWITSLNALRDWVFSHADVTENHPGGSPGREFGFAATVSLDDNPADVKRPFSKYGLYITSH